MTKLLPEMWRLANVARELHVHSSTLVDASRRGRFPPVVRVGGVWMVQAESVREWFSRQHAAPLNPGKRVAVKAALRGGAAGLRARRRGRARASSGASS